LPTPEKEPEIKRKEPEIPSQQVITPDDFEPETRTSLRMKRNKTRRMALSISVSEEEAELLRRHAASLDLGFSAWARQTLFRAMGRKPPARPKR
jgi:hypothetical protein